MKCISCGNLIPDASVVCPYCNTKVAEPTPVAPVYAEVNLPLQSQQIPEQIQVVQEVPVMGQSTLVEQNPVQNVVQASVGPEVPVAPAAPVTPVAPATPVASVAQEVSVQAAPYPGAEPTQPVLEQNVIQQDGMPESRGFMATPAPTTGMVAQGVQPAMGFDGGQRIATTVNKPENKKMSTTKLIVIIVVAVVLISIIAGVVLFFNSQYNTADKRMDAIINAVFKEAIAVKNEDIEFASGTYSFDASVNANAFTMKSSLNGKYGVDVKKGIADYTLNITSLNIGQE